MSFDDLPKKPHDLATRAAAAGIDAVQKMAPGSRVVFIVDPPPELTDGEKRVGFGAAGHDSIPDVLASMIAEVEVVLKAANTGVTMEDLVAEMRKKQAAQ